MINTYGDDMYSRAIKTKWSNLILKSQYILYEYTKTTPAERRKLRQS